MFKKLLIFLAVVIIGVIAAIAIFIATFDINAYRPAVKDAMSKAVGNPVEIDKLSLQWKGRLVLGIDGFRVMKKDEGKNAASISVDHADAALELAPLVNRVIDIPSISILRPRIELIREKSGAIKVSGIEAAKPEGKPAAETKLAIPGISDIKIRSLELRDGIAGFTDMTTEPVSSIKVSRLDADIRNISLTVPLEFSVRAAVASNRQNLRAEGAIGGFVTGDLYVNDMKVSLDLNALDKDAIFKALPALSAAGLAEPPSGELKAIVRNLQMAGGKLGRISADADLKGGRLVMRQVMVPIEDVGASASIEDSTLNVKSFAARMANGSFSMSGKSRDVFTSPKTSVSGKIDVQGLSSFIKSVTGAKQNIDGNLSLTFDGNMTGTSADEIKRTLAGKGSLSLSDGVIVDTNLLSQTLGALTLFPGLLEMFSGFVPESVKKSFGEEYTILKPFSRSFTVEGGYIQVPDLVFETDVAVLRGAASASFTGDISMKGMMEFTEEVSRSIEKAVSQTQYLENTARRIEFPIAVKSGTDGFRVIPDLQYVGKKIAIAGAQDAAINYLQKLATPEKKAE